MKPVDNINKLLKKSRAVTSIEMDQKIHNDISELQKKSKTRAPAISQQVPSIWRIIMKSKITKIAAASIIIVALTIILHQFGSTIRLTNTAFAEMKQAIDKVPWIHIVLKTV